MLLLGVEIETCEGAMAYLGMPPDSTWVRIGTEKPVKRSDPSTTILIRAAPAAGLTYNNMSSPTHVLAQWHGFGFDMFGRIVPDVETDQRPYWRFAGDAGLLVEVWYARAFTDDRLVIAQGFWSVLQGHCLAITRAGLGWDGTSLKLGGRAIRVLQRFDKQRGRPKGTGTYPDGAALRDVIDPIVSQLRAKRLHPTQPRVAKQMPGKVDVRVLRDWVTDLLEMDWESYLNSVR